ncbi:MAG: hypothetical protein MUF51_00415 [Vicinamibacteria bacterium]|jgi:hypothetical protein|nr:hypothetical protein [Vicinamibacteria bacterium]
MSRLRHRDLLLSLNNANIEAGFSAPHPAQSRDHSVIAASLGFNTLSQPLRAWRKDEDERR